MTTSTSDSTVNLVEPSPAVSSDDTFKNLRGVPAGLPRDGQANGRWASGELLDGVLVDNALINRPLLELFQWDGITPLPAKIWQYADPIRDAVLATIEDLAPPINSYVFTNVIVDGPAGADEYDRVRSVAFRRGSLFLSVLLTCDIDVQVSRIANPDRVALRKGADPQGYRGHRLTTTLYQPPAAEVFHIDTTETPAADNALRVLTELVRRGFVPRRE